MRKTATFSVLFAIMLAGVAPLTAQRLVSRTDAKIQVRATEFETVQALTEGSGVLVQWTMKSEVTAGFNVYRIDSTSKEKVNASFLAGSLSRYGEAVAVGEMHQFFDTEGSAGARYVLEAVGPDGRTSLSSEVRAVTVRSLETETGISEDVFRNAANSNNSSIENRTAELSRELADLVSLYTQQPDAVNQKLIASKPGAKLAIKEDGFYRVPLTDLQFADFPIDSDSTKWRLFTNGVEQAIIVGPNQSYIEFYGRAADLPETDTRIYYLIADTVAGKRIATKRLRTLPGEARAANYPVVATKKERKEFNSKLFNGDDENYLGRFFSIDPVTIRFNLSGVDRSVPEATVKVSLYGLTNAEHEVTAKLNGFDLPPMRGTGQVFFSGEVRVPTTSLVDGVNELRLLSHAPSDFTHFDKVEVSYRRSFVADSGRLSFSSAGQRRLELDGFGSEAIRVFDLTFEGNPVLLSGLGITDADLGFQVRVPSTRAMVGYAVEDSALLRPVSVTANRPSTLSATDRRADMLIISHSSPGFISASEGWAAYRRTNSGGALSVDVIDVADVYDEFNFGLVGAAAIKSFLQHAATEWAVAPRYVLLMGDSTYDPRNYEGWGEFNLVPTKVVTLLAEESGSDEALGDFDGDGLSALAIGRIPARNPAQIATALRKTMEYEADQADFSRGVLFAHDSSPEFEAMSQQLAQRLPEGTPFTMVSAGEIDANANLLAAMRTGKFFVNYSGHGSTGLWSSGDFFSLPMVPLATSRRASVYSMLTCVNGFFLRPNADALSERLLFSDTGGAAAAWASTSFTTSDDQLRMADKYFEGMAESGEGRMGDLIKEAKIGLDAGPDVRLSWVLLGDPVIRTP
jgi:hypothetical protein